MEELKINHLITYDAGKRCGKIINIRSNGKHTYYKLDNGSELADLQEKVGRPGGVVIIDCAIEKSETLLGKLPPSVVEKLKDSTEQKPKRGRRVKSSRKDNKD